MKKDTIVAIIIGFVLGSLLAIILINIPNLTKKSQNTQNITPTPTQTAITPQNTATLTVTSPKNEQIASEKNITVTGKYLSQQRIIIETDTEIKIAKTNENGEFSEKINLSEGANLIQFTTYYETEPITTNINIYYISEKL